MTLLRETDKRLDSSHIILPGASKLYQKAWQIFFPVMMNSDAILADSLDVSLKLNPDEEEVLLSGENV